MKEVTLSDLARRTASTVGRNVGVQITFSGKTAFTTGKRINLPSLIAGSTLTEKEYRMFTGYLDHEISHTLHSDFAVVNDAVKAGKLCKHIANILEDVRIENKYLEKYPGAKSPLDEVCSALEQDYAQELRIAGENLGELDIVKAVNLIYEKAYTFRGRELIRSESLDSFPDLKKINKAVEKAVTEDSTRKVLIQSEIIVKELNRLFKEDAPPKEAEPQQEPNGFAGKPSEGEVSDSETQDSPTEKESGESDTPDEEDGDLEEESSEESGEDSEPSEESESGESDGGAVGDQEDFQEEEGEGIEEAIKFLIAMGNKNNMAGVMLQNLMAQEAIEDGKVTNTAPNKAGKLLAPVSTLRDKVFYPPKEDLDSYVRTLATIPNEVSMLKKSLHIFLKSRALKTYERGLEAGSLDSQSVWKLRAEPNPRIFKEKRKIDMVDTAVCLMLDLSGSMNTQLLKTTGVLLTEALLGVQSLKVQIVGFTTYDSTNVISGAGGRAVPLDFPLYKDYEESGRHVKGRIGTIESKEYTPLGEAFALGYESLLKRKESKKVLWVVTDGDPSFVMSDRSHNDFLLMKRIQNKCKEKNIQLLGLELGAHQDFLRHFVDSNTRINGINHMPEAVLSMVKSLVSLKRGR